MGKTYLFDNIKIENRLNDFEKERREQLIKDFDTILDLDSLIETFFGISSVIAIFVSIVCFLILGICDKFLFLPFFLLCLSILYFLFLLFFVGDDKKTKKWIAKIKKIPYAFEEIENRFLYTNTIELENNYRKYEDNKEFLCLTRNIEINIDKEDDYETFIHIENKYSDKNGDIHFLNVSFGVTKTKINNKIDILTYDMNTGTLIIPADNKGDIKGTIIS